MFEKKYSQTTKGGNKNPYGQKIQRWIASLGRIKQELSGTYIEGFKNYTIIPSPQGYNNTQ